MKTVRAAAHCLTAISFLVLFTACADHDPNSPKTPLPQESTSQVNMNLPGDYSQVAESDVAAGTYLIEKIKVQYKSSSNGADLKASIVMAELGKIDDLEDQVVGSYNWGSAQGQFRPEVKAYIPQSIASEATGLKLSENRLGKVQFFADARVAQPVRWRTAGAENNLGDLEAMGAILLHGLMDADYQPEDCPICYVEASTVGQLAAANGSQLNLKQAGADQLLLSVVVPDQDESVTLQLYYIRQN